MRFGTVLLMSGFCMAGAASAQEAAAPPVPDFSVLTPSMDGRFAVSNDLDPFAFLPYVGGLAGVGDQAKSRQLRQIVEANRYDPMRPIAERLVAALREAGYAAVHEPIERSPPGSVQSLAWSDLPAHPQGRFFLDVNIRGICLCTGIDHFKYRPGISIGWRLLDPRQEVVEPTRRISYVYAPGWDARKTSSIRTVSGSSPPAPYPPVEVSETCGFAKVADAAENPALLWGCLAEAYDVVIQRLVIDLKRLRPPAAAVTVSSGIQSGTSTQ